MSKDIYNLAYELKDLLSNDQRVKTLNELENKMNNDNDEKNKKNVYEILAKKRESMIRGNKKRSRKAESVHFPYSGR